MTAFKRQLGCSAAIALALLALADPAAAQNTQRRIPVALAEQPLDRALEQLARESGNDILFPPAVVAGLRAPSLVGEFDAETAVRRLIAGTGLTVTRDGNGALIIRGATRPDPVPATDQAGNAYSVDDVIVTGYYSRGVARALDLKRDADSISDAVVASDVGKLPAFNIAEALQRVPGVSIVREAGEGQFISVRGLGPNFQAVTFNGMPLAYNENIRNSGQSGRQFRLQVLPASLIDSVVVTKSPTADMVENGVGSNVDIRLINPLDRDPFLAVSAFGGYEERTETLSPNGAASVGWRNADRTLGVIGGLSYSRRDVQFDRLRNGWSTMQIAGLGSVRVPGDVQPYLELEDRERISAVAGFQWRPTANLEFDFDGLLSQFNNETYERRLTYYIPSQIARLDLSTAVVEDGRLVSGTIRGGRIRNYSEYLDQSHQNLQLNGTMRLQLGDWKIEPRVSYSRALSDLDTPIQRVQYRTASGAGGNVTFDFRGDVLGDARIPSLFTDLDLTNPALMPFETFQVRPINSEDEDKTAVLNVVRESDLDFGGLQLTRVHFGGQYSDRFRDYQRRDRSNTVLRPGATRTGAFLGFPAPGNAFDQSIGTFQRWNSVDWDLFNASYVLGTEFDGVSPDAQDLNPTAADLQNSYRIEEQISAGYGRADFATSIASRTVTGNIGLRYVEVNSAVTGTILSAAVNGAGAVTTVRTPLTTESSYAEWLPSLNARIELGDNLQLRFGAARTITPPSLSELRNSINTNSVTVTTIFNRGAAALTDPTLNLTAAAGNPDLEPYTSVNLDASLEWYFENFGALTLAVFHKDVSGYIASDFQTRTLPFAVNDGSTLPVDVLVSTPTNVGDALIQGVEFGYTKKLESGLGLTATATFASSDLELDRQGVGLQTAGIKGVSDTSFSITPFFERGPFEINASYTYRSSYLTDAGAVVTSLPTPEDVVAYYQDGFGILDMGASYQLRSDIELFVQAVNVLDARQVSYAGTREEFSEIHTFGRTLNLGFRARF